MLKNKLHLISAQMQHNYYVSSAFILEYTISIYLFSYSHVSRILSSHELCTKNAIVIRNVNLLGRLPCSHIYLISRIHKVEVFTQKKKVEGKGNA